MVRATIDKYTEDVAVDGQRFCELSLVLSPGTISRRAGGRRWPRCGRPAIYEGLIVRMMNDLTSLFIRMVELVAEYRITAAFLRLCGFGGRGRMAHRRHGVPASICWTPRMSAVPIPFPRPAAAGVGILAAFIMAGLTLRIPTTFLFAAILISAVSFYGDYIRISVKFRLVFQVISTVILLFPLLPRLSAHYALSTLGFPRSSSF